MAETKEKKIPVFTVSKNGAILKNIFIVNRPPDHPSPPSSAVQNAELPNQELEETLVVGRHPDCDIMLTHPSISRFHLRINSRSSSQKLSVVDLSSVHGTWASEMKIEPGVPVELNEGDTLRVGGSTRVYRLHWMPMNHAYEVQNQFVSPKGLVEIETEEKEEENVVDHNASSIDVECVMDEYSSVVDDIAEASKDQSSQLDKDEQIQLLDVIFEGVGSLFSHCWSSESEFVVKKEIPSAPPMPENLNCSICNEEVGNGNSSRGSETTVEQLDACTLNIPCVSVMKYISGKDDAERSLKTSEQITNLLSDFDTALTVSDELKVHSVPEILEETRNQESMQNVHQEMDIQEPFPELLMPELTNSSQADVLIDANLTGNFDTSSVLQELEVQSALEILERTKDQKPLQKDHQEMDIPGPFLNPSQVEVLTFAVMGTNSEQVNKENQAPQFFMTELVNLPQPEVLADTNHIVVSDTSSVLQELEVQSAAEVLEETENQKPLQEDVQEMDITEPSSKPLMIDLGSPSQTEKSTAMGTNSELVNEENRAAQPLLILQPPFERGKEVNAQADQEGELQVDVNQTCTDQNEESHPTEITNNAEKESIRKEFDCESETCNSIPLPTESSLPLGKICSHLPEEEKIKTSESVHIPVALSEHEKLNSSPRLEKIWSSDSLWSRRGKPASTLQIRTVASTGKGIGAGKDAANKLIPQSLFHCSPNVEDDIFTPDKENFTSNTLLLKSLKNSPNTCASSCKKTQPRTTFSPIVQPENDSMSTSDKENQTRKILEEQKLVRNTSRNQGKLEKDKVVVQRRIERNPLQSLPVNSGGKSISEASAPSVCSKTFEKRIAHTSSNNSAGERRKIWTMVVDITSLMDKESRKTLQLLRGLKGTRLVIPRMVIRELDSLNRRGSLFRRKTEAASVLEWIEDCMLNTKWWIHIQSSVEEGPQTLPTPPASPQSQFNESSATFLSGRLTEITSPTAEDHVVDYALRLRPVKKDGQLVLLSNDVNMKIKAMAEGLLCETVTEFRQSLVNPFSDRFLWAESSPRGQTWSCLEDVVLRERYERGPSKKGECAKGLKLILLHNSHCGKKMNRSIR